MANKGSWTELARDLLREDGLISEDNPILKDGRLPTCIREKVQPGMKASKLLHLLLVYYTGYDEAGATAAMSPVLDEMAAKSKPQKMVISANILDYAMSSWNCPWDSCHKPDGSMRSGPIQYMQEPFTIVTYGYQALSTPYQEIAGGHKLPMKSWRCLIHFLPAQHGKVNVWNNPVGRDRIAPDVDVDGPPTVNLSRIYGTEPDSLKGKLKSVAKELAEELGWDMTGMGWSAYPLNAKGYNQVAYLDGAWASLTTDPARAGVYKCEPVACPRCGDVGHMVSGSGALQCKTCLYLTDQQIVTGNR